MEMLKKLKQKLEEKNVQFQGQGQWLQLGVKQKNGGVKSTGFHKVKLLEEPKVVKKRHAITGVERDELLFLLEEDGEEKKWSFPIFKLDERGYLVKDENGNPIAHYLLSSPLEDIEVGDWFGLEMIQKGKGSETRHIIEVTYPLPSEDENERVIEEYFEEEEKEEEDVDKPDYIAEDYVPDDQTIEEEIGIVSD